MSVKEAADILQTVIHNFNLLKGQKEKISCAEIEMMNYRIKSKLRRGFTYEDGYMDFINFNFRVLKMLEKIKEFPVTSHGNMLRQLLDDLYKNYCNVVGRFPQEKQLMISYVEFTKKFHYNEEVGTAFNGLLHDKSCTNDMYEFAISRLFNELNLAEKSHDVLFQGVEKFSSETLYLKAFTLDLDRTKGVEEKKNDDAESVGLKNATVMEQKQDGDNEQMNLAACPDDLLIVCNNSALQFFIAVMKTNPSVHLAYKFLDIARDYHSLHEVEDSILTYIFKMSPFDEAAWNMYIRHELKELYPSQFLDVEATPKYSLEKRTKWCYEVFQRALKFVNTEKMWTNFIDICIKLHSDETLKPVFERGLLMKALKDAYKAENLSEEYFVLWVSKILDLKKKFLPSQDDQEGQPQEKKKKIEEILQAAVNKFPTNFELCRGLLRFYIRYNMEEEIIMTLRDASVRISDKDKMCELLELCLQYYQLVSVSKQEEMYKIAVEPTSAVAEHFKPQYLLWAALTDGIDGARRVYDGYATKPPFSLEFHTKMLSFENILPSTIQGNRNYVQQCYENMCSQFGKQNHDVWIDYIKYEKGKGRTKYVRNLIKQAKKMLHPNHLGNFKKDLSALGLGFK